MTPPGVRNCRYGPQMVRNFSFKPTGGITGRYGLLIPMDLINNPLSFEAFSWLLISEIFNRKVHEGLAPKEPLRGKGRKAIRIQLPACRAPAPKLRRRRAGRFAFFA